VIGLRFRAFGAGGTICVAIGRFLLLGVSTADPVWFIGFGMGFLMRAAGGNEAAQHNARRREEMEGFHAPAIA
jgi:hypothetical protein